MERYRFQVLETSGLLDGVMLGHQGDDLERKTRVQRKKRRRHIPFRFCLVICPNDNRHDPCVALKK